MQYLYNTTDIINTVYSHVAGINTLQLIKCPLSFAAMIALTASTNLLLCATVS